MSDNDDKNDNNYDLDHDMMHEDNKKIMNKIL